MKSEDKDQELRKAKENNESQEASQESFQSKETKKLVSKEEENSGPEVLRTEFEAKRKTFLFALGDQKEKDDSFDQQEYDRILNHIALHKKLAQAKVPRDIFLRFTITMKEQGFLRLLIPGIYSLWRRSFYFSIAGLILTLLLFMFFDTKIQSEPDKASSLPSSTLTLIGGGVQGKISSQPLPFGKVLSLQDNEGIISIATNERGVYTRFHLEAGSRFKLASRQEIQIFQGKILQADIRLQAHYRKKFSIHTPQAHLKVRGASFALQVGEINTFLTVVSGRVDASSKEDASNKEVIISAGNSILIEKGKPPAFQEPFLQIVLEPFTHRGQIRVNIKNHAAFPIRIRKAGGPGKFPYELNFIQDRLESDQENFILRRTVPPLPGVLEQGEEYETHFGWITLNSAYSKGNNSYQFVVDAKSIVRGLTEQDITVFMRYLGRAQSRHFGVLDIKTLSPYLRINVH